MRASSRSISGRSRLRRTCCSPDTIGEDARRLDPTRPKTAAFHLRARWRKDE
ncbi:hypothetical protein [Nonomuraea sp. NPDC003709]|uniref:hypothetical protein n=1 Tax=Nonomuraea sp. NPDC003709 TaxID=3154450 RepID=UPI0033AB1531